MNSAAQSNAEGTVVYDGSCSFCIARVNGLQRRDTEHRLAFMPWQDELAEKQFPQMKGRSLDDGILFIDSSGHVSAAADAIYQIWRRIPSLKGWTRLYRVPFLKPFIRAGYALVAANRKRIGQTCDNNVCKRP